jgi:nucleoside-diphosphate-sugar epimerase
MRLLITGGSGFIGRHIVNAALKRCSSSDEIVVISRDTSSCLSLFSDQRITFLDGDISAPTPELFSTLNSDDILIHLAWGGLPNYKELIHIEKNLFEHYHFLKRVLEAGVTNVTVAGTCLEYGMVEGELREEMVANPQNPYAVAKDSLRRSLEFLGRDKQLKLKWLRLFYTYGEGQPATSLIPQLERAVKARKSKFDTSPGDQVRDFTEASLLAEYIVTCSLQTSATGIINCCSGKPVTVAAFIESYIKDHELSIELNRGVYPYPDYEPFAFWGSRKRLDTILEHE